MASTLTPVQIRYNTPYDDQTLFDYDTIYSKLYRARETNKLLNLIGQDVVLKGLNISSISIIGASTIQAVVSSGVAIQDSVLIKLTANSTIDLDCSGFADTTSGNHLGIFLNYQFLNTTSINEARIGMYYVASDGTVIDPSSTYNSNSCRILLGMIDFYKSGTTLTSIKLSELPSFSISGSTMYIRGRESSHANLPNLFQIMFNEYYEFLLKQDIMVS